MLTLRATRALFGGKYHVPVLNPKSSFPIQGFQYPRSPPTDIQNLLTAQYRTALKELRKYHDWELRMVLEHELRYKYRYWRKRSTVDSLNTGTRWMELMLSLFPQGGALAIAPYLPRLRKALQHRGIYVEPVEPWFHNLRGHHPVRKQQYEMVRSRPW